MTAMASIETIQKEQSRGETRFDNEDPEQGFDLRLGNPEHETLETVKTAPLVDKSELTTSKKTEIQRDQLPGMFAHFIVEYRQEKVEETNRQVPPAP